jgi:fructose-1,6-bisphosphatase I
VTSSIQNLHGNHETGINDNHLNFSGDIQKKLDVISNEIMINHLIESESCCLLLSEENEDVILVEKEKRGKYMVTFDPLDGSSNIDCNVCIGTIFSIYESVNKDIYDEVDYLRNGNEMICAGYCLYGPSTEMVITIGMNNGVHQFTLHPHLKDFVYVKQIQFPEKHKKIYSVNESSFENWSSSIQNYVLSYKIKNTPYTQRYVGSMVADVHRTLLYGGMFMYPADEKNKKGKLRYYYECAPISKIVEEAGGKSIIPNENPIRILDLEIGNIHEKTPILLGTSSEVDKYMEYV